jgi:glycosyltransferase involved in cell wall biosynthesis
MGIMTQKQESLRLNFFNRNYHDRAYRRILRFLNPKVPYSHDFGYYKWLVKHHLRKTDLENRQKAVETFNYKPVISIIVPVYNTPETFLREMIESVLAQVYPHWELCICDDASPQPQVQTILQEYVAKDPRIKVVRHEKNQHISHTSNSAIALATGEFISLLDHDDILTPDALYEIALLLNRHPEADFIYSDEDKLFDDRTLGSPYFKPDWSPDSLLTRMYTCHFSTYRRTLIEKLGGFRAGFEGSQDYDLVLRVTEQTDRIFHIPKMLYHWRNHSGSTATSIEAKPYALNAAKKAIAEALQRRGEEATILDVPSTPGFYSIRFKVQPADRVSIVIPLQSSEENICRCLQSIFSKSQYSNYEVIAVGENAKISQSAAIKQWAEKEPQRFTVVESHTTISSQQINQAVTQAKGSYLLLLSDSTEIITPDWLDSLLAQAQRQSIGAVSGLILNPDDTVASAGLILGSEGEICHSHRGYPADSPGYLGFLRSINNYAAVSAVCLMCSRNTYLEQGGLDESLDSPYSDADLCLKMLKAGYRNLCLPHVSLYHHKTSEKHEFRSNPEPFQTRWQDLIQHDPYYSPHFSSSESYQIKS